MGCFGCFDGGKKQQLRKEEDRLASQEARAKAAEAAQKREKEDSDEMPCFALMEASSGKHNLSFDRKHVNRIFLCRWIQESSSRVQRQEEFDKSAAGRAARAQQAAIAKQSANTNRGEPVLKWQMG
ncbi:uncharacterized protein LOC141688876 isoform X1 [Apium graveolens]|uniref:uncharacterized protein LOC141688876 isoform X1 n=1 Tax=Apium graveolens TaxID=4045 RepID=UPI003D7B25D0